jgi:hypothetical protein
MYDPFETDASHRYLGILAKAFGRAIALIGGWAVFYLVNDRYRSATGHEYLRSRDIDLIISPAPRFSARFGSSVRKMGFVEGGLPFRYQLIIDRDSGAVLGEKEAARLEPFQLIYIFLDVFSSRKVTLGTWVIPGLGKAFGGRRPIEGVQVAPPGEVLEMKLRSLGERADSEKREKDACDIYALLHYSSLDEMKLPKNPALAAMAAEHSEYIAEALFHDRNYGGLVRRNIESRIRGAEKRGR